MAKKATKKEYQQPGSNIVISSLSWLLLIAASLSRSAAALSTPASMGDTAERPSRYYPSFCEALPPLAGGKTVVVTGASRGLGLVTARTVAARGGRVIALSRASDRAARALEQMSSAATGAPPALVACDLTSFESVRRACQEVRELTEDAGIDVLCCNAGVMLQPDTATVDGYDVTAATNVLSHFLIVKELFPELCAAARKHGGARVVTMSSGSGYGGPPFDARFFARSGGSLGGDAASYERYHQSKLANLAFAAALDRRRRQSGGDGAARLVRSLACTPGVCGSDMFVHATRVMTGRPARRDAVPSVEDGALAQLKCIFDPDVASGELWGPAMGGEGDEFGLQRTAICPPQILVDGDTCNAVWKACEDAVGTFTL